MGNHPTPDGWTGSPMEEDLTILLQGTSGRLSYNHHMDIEENIQAGEEYNLISVRDKINLPR